MMKGDSKVASDKIVVCQIIAGEGSLRLSIEIGNQPVLYPCDSSAGATNRSSALDN